MRKITATTNVANFVIAVTGKGWMKFNDKLKDGTRSSKVLGWSETEYEMARKMLHTAGHDVWLVEYDGYSVRGGRNYTQTRLHVKEA